MEPLYSTRATWDWKRLIFSVVGTSLLFWTWYLIPLVRQGWQGFDEWVFYTLNGTLRDYPGTMGVWAFGSTRLFDLFVFFIQLLCFVGRSSGEERLRRFSQFLFYIIFAHLALALTHGIMTRTLDIARISPTPALADGVRLKKYFVGPLLFVKDSSWHSFPGDHSAIFFMWACFMGFFRGRSAGLVSLMVAAVISLPRLVSGAHWASDALVGSVSIGWLLYSLAVYTPLNDWCIRSIFLPSLRFLSGSRLLVLWPWPRFAYLTVRASQS